MALKAIIESVEGLDEAVKGLYREIKDEKHPAHGKFMLDVEPVAGVSLEDVSGLKNALSQERSLREKAEKASKAFEGLDPKAAREAMQRIEELGEIDPAKEADRIVEERVKTVRAKLEDTFGKEREKLQSELNSLREEANRNAILRARDTAYQEHGVLMDRAQPLNWGIERYTRVKVSDDGKRHVYVVDDDGNPRVNARGDNMSLSDFVAEMKGSETFQHVFRGPDGSGAGSPGGHKGGGAASKRTSELTKAEKAKMLAEGKLKPADLANAS